MTAFGFTLPQRGVFFGVTTVPRMLALAARADASDLFGSIWVGDSLMAKPRPDSLTLLGSLAAATRRVTLGVGCMASFPVRDPIVFAYQWATLDLLSGGRMLLAACTGLVAGGASAREGAHWGVVDRERPDRLAENIEICRRLWSEDRVTFKGRFRSFEDVTIQPKPVQRPCPVWIASNPRAAGLRTAIAGYLREQGRDPAAFPTMAYHNVNLNADRQAALAETKRFLDEYYGPVFSPAMVEAWTAAGTVEQCVDHLRVLRRDGARTVTLRITAWNQEEQFERLVGEVLPRLAR
jgi:alkanesulfonate monooxygenase SsuD/methylene tetrahydromethanopterin reductase-like flavin-dependent oxidoreductase (luciferase family)